MAAYAIRAVVDEFAKSCTLLKIEHDLFVSLFDRGEHHRDLLQRAAPFLFGDIYATMRNHLFIGFCRITDPAGTGSKTNLTSNFILTRLSWSLETSACLVEINERLMKFRSYVELARNRRIAHMDLKAQMEQEGPLGGFPAGADDDFFDDLEKFVTTAYHDINGGPFLISVGVSTDTHQLIRALRKAELYDRCDNCREIDRIIAVLDAEEQG